MEIGKAVGRVCGLKKFWYGISIRVPYFFEAEAGWQGPQKVFRRFLTLASPFFSFRFVNMNNRSSHLKRTYGLSEDAYDAQARSQNYLCAVCHEQNPIGRDGQPKILAVDHNHRTDANRGLLCDRCNKVLGFVKDSQEVLLRLLFYLRSHDGPSVEYTPDNYITRAARDASSFRDGRPPRSCRRRARRASASARPAPTTARSAA